MLFNIFNYYAIIIINQFNFQTSIIFFLDADLYISYKSMFVVLH